MGRLALASVLVLLLLSSPLGLDDLPDPVVKFLRLEVGGDDVVSVAKTRTSGDDAYLITWSADEVTIETTLSAGGAVLSRRAVAVADGEDSSPLESDDDDQEDFEREITIDRVPEPARSAILREAGAHKIAEVEMVIVRGELLYEADWIIGDHEVGVRVGPDGRVLAREREQLEAGDDER